MLWIIIQYYAISFAAQILSALATGSSFSLASCPFDILASSSPSFTSFSFSFFLHFFTFQALKELSLSIYSFNRTAHEIGSQYFPPSTDEKTEVQTWPCVLCACACGHVIDTEEVGEASQCLRAFQFLIPASPETYLYFSQVL